MYSIFSPPVNFSERLAKEKAVRKGAIPKIGVVGMRVDARTRSAEQLHRFVEGLKLPVLGYLRDTQNYVQLAAHGLTLWDVAKSRVEKGPGAVATDHPMD